MLVVSYMISVLCCIYTISVICCIYMINVIYCIFTISVICFIYMISVVCCKYTISANCCIYMIYQAQLSLNAGQKYCRMLQVEPSVLTFDLHQASICHLDLCVVYF